MLRPALGALASGRNALDFSLLAQRAWATKGGWATEGVGLLVNKGLKTLDYGAGPFTE